MGRCYNTAVINAPIETVWETIRSFHDFSWASNVITKLDIVGDVAGDQVGAKRILNDLFHETLQTLMKRILALHIVSMMDPAQLLRILLKTT